MGRIVSTMMVSADGITEAPVEWGMRYFDEDQRRDAVKRMLISDGLLMGRLTYEAFAAVWPDRQGAFADRLNTLPKFVFSSSLAQAGWVNSTILPADDIARAAARLKQETSGDLVVFGHGRLARTLLEAQLIDELRMAIKPVLVGKGEGLRSQKIRCDLTLASCETFHNGVVVHTYRPDYAPRRAAA